MSFFTERPLSPKAIKGFDTAPLTKNYYTVVSVRSKGKFVLTGDGDVLLVKPLLILRSYKGKMGKTCFVRFQGSLYYSGLHL
jgi:hypothetical protein